MSVLICAICTFWGPTASATYRLRDLGVLPNTTSSSALAINNAGIVVGYSMTSGGTHVGFRWAGAMLNIGNLGGPDTAGTGINATGQIAGWSSTGYNYNAFFLSGGVMTNLGNINNCGAASYGFAINAPGHAVGWSSTCVGAEHAFLYTGGVMQDLGTLPGGPYGTSSYAYGINDLDYVVGTSGGVFAGSHPFLSVPSLPLQDLGTLGGTSGTAFAINNHNTVVGGAFNSSGLEHAFMWNNGPMTDLGTLGGSSSEAQGVNKQDAIVGWSYVANGVRHGFVAYCHFRMIDLNTMLDASGAGYTITNAHAINDNGQIAADATINGATHAVLLTFNGTLSC